MTEFTVPVMQQVPVKTLQAIMGVRYWEDGEVNGVADDEDSPKMPLKQGDTWVLNIDLSTGVILDWPNGTTAKTHYKVCDAGIYRALNAAGDVIAEIDGYVPSMLYPNASGYGDYVILSIDAGGKIEGWNPDMSAFEAPE